MSAITPAGPSAVVPPPPFPSAPGLLAAGYCMTPFSRHNTPGYALHRIGHTPFCLLPKKHTPQHARPQTQPELRVRHNATSYAEAVRSGSRQDLFAGARLAIDGLMAQPADVANIILYYETELANLRQQVKDKDEALRKVRQLPLPQTLLLCSRHTSHGRRSVRPLPAALERAREPDDAEGHDRQVGRDTGQRVVGSPALRPLADSFRTNDLGGRGCQYHDQEEGRRAVVRQLAEGCARRASWV